MKILRQQFLEKWTLEKVKNMTLEEYTSVKSKGNRDDFTFWIENKMESVISFWGGSSEKFGIYLRGNQDAKIDKSDKRDTDGEYTWYKKYGNSKDEVFQTVKEIIVSIIQYAKNQEFDKIDDIDLGKGYKWTIAYHYAPENTLLRIVSENAFQYLSRMYFDGKYKKISAIQKALIGKKPENLSFDEYSTQLYDKYQKSNFVVKCRKQLESIVGKINSDFNNPLSINLTQKNQANISIKRVDKKEKTLSINIISRENCYRIGIDRDLEHQVNQYLISQNYKKTSDTEQNDRWSCSIGEIENIIYKYAEIQKQPNKTTSDKNMKIPLNQILYGPPGTGKTYSTVGEALKILEATDKQKQNIKNIGQLKEEFGSQVEFITFHQSFSYEDFVEGLKANSDGETLTYNIESGIFKQICGNARKNIENSQNSTQNQIDIKLLLNDFANYIEEENIRNEKVLLAKKSGGFWGDTYFGETLRKTDETFKSFKTTGSVASQNLTEKIIIRDYQQFYDGDIKGYKDIKPAQKSKVNYHGNALYYYQLFKRIKAFQDEQFDRGINYIIDNSKQQKNFVLIIDEINRGNISRIFGELITLIEPSKRAGEGEEISVKLPYSKDDFSVPNNLHIIGTMNTADRSLALMDTALRRRFDFVEMLPDESLITEDCNGVNLQKMLKFINQRIEVLYDREHMIGHSFLMGIDDLERLQNAFKNKILPLLEEYFYDDFKKICQVLADKNGNFYKEMPVKDDLFLGMEVDTQNRVIYEKQDISKLNDKDFIQIYPQKTNTK